MDLCCRIEPMTFSLRDNTPGFTRVHSSPLACGNALTERWYDGLGAVSTATELHHTATPMDAELLMLRMLGDGPAAASPHPQGRRLDRGAERPHRSDCRCSGDAWVCGVAIHFARPPQAQGQSRRGPWAESSSCPAQWEHSFSGRRPTCCSTSVRLPLASRDGFRTGYPATAAPT